MNKINLSRSEFEKIFELSQGIITGLKEISQKFKLSKELKKNIEDLKSFADQIMSYFVKNDPLYIK